MARETFISYKYSEAQNLRDRIIEELGEDARYYKGETAESPDLGDTTTENIKENLKNMMFGTSVTIVIISPNMTQSKWIDWEIAYTLKCNKRGQTTSGTNGIVGVIMKVNGDYNWLVSFHQNQDGCTYRYSDKTKMYDIINGNRLNNITPDKYTCETCQLFDGLNGSYLSLITEDEFLTDPSKYIENAYDKSQTLDDFKLQREK